MFATGAVDYPIILVETDEGTLAAPLLLDEMEVQVTASEGATPETVTFASLGKPTSGTLKKRGTGHEGIGALYNGAQGVNARSSARTAARRRARNRSSAWAG